jgi:hypothetical protein
MLRSPAQLNAVRCYAERCYAECHYADCHGADASDSQFSWQKSLKKPKCRNLVTLLVGFVINFFKSLPYTIGIPFFSTNLLISFTCITL